MSELKPGQRVKIEVEGVIPEMGGGCDASFVTSRHPEYGTFNSGRLYVKNLSNLKVAVLDPADWPPQAGDIWAADGQEWFARKGADADLMMIPEDRGFAPREAGRFLALNPALVRRRGQ